jgi:hypothetical protein
VSGIFGLVCARDVADGPQRSSSVSPFAAYPPQVLSVALELLTLTTKSTGSCRDFVVNNRGSVMQLLLPCFKLHDEVCRCRSGVVALLSLAFVDC